MEGKPRYSRALQSHLSSSLKLRRSGYEPSDTETEMNDSPWHEPDQETEDSEGLNMLQDQDSRNKTPLNLSRRTTKKLEFDATVPLRRDDIRPDLDSQRNVSPFSKSEFRRKNPDDVKPDSDFPSPFSRSEHPRYNRGSANGFLKPEHRRHISPYKNNTNKVSEISNYRRATSAPRARLKEYESIKNEGDKEKKRGNRNVSPLPPRNAFRKHNPSGGEINEMLANAKISEAPPDFAPTFQSTDSIAPGDIFFSRDYAPTMQNSVFSKNSSTGSKFSQIQESYTERDPDPHQGIKGKYQFNQHIQVKSASNVSARSSINSRSAVSRQTSNLSEYSGRTNGSTGKFIANRQKNQSEKWYSCIKKGSCANSKRYPEQETKRYEASVIEKAFVVENLKQFWADKHQPGSLTGFTCHKQEAHKLKQLVSGEIFPHIVLKGPPGSGKKALTMALLSEIYGPPAWDISHELRYFHVRDTREREVAVPLTSSPHHVELNVNVESNAIYALLSTVKQISADHAVAPEISTFNMKADYKVIVLYEVDKAADNIQHLIKWIMDGYSDSCKLILCCEDDTSILEHVKSRCKTFKVEPPVTHEIMEVLIQIARKEDFELPMSFAAKIANKSKQNMRKAIMALEACKAHNYPFAEDQPIPLGWEEAVAELASEILSDPSPKKLFFIRGKFQKLLTDFVHPKLILLKLVEQFMKRAEAGSKRELYFWHAYYDKRIPPGASALLKLEEFTAKIMSIYRKSYNQHQI